MRLYTFINYYLSSIQQGIQSAHIVSELFAHKFEPKKASMIKNWAVNHKTIICCNGGNNKSLDELVALFSSLENPYPFIEFYEDEESLGGVRTGVGIILPEHVYDVEYFEHEEFYQHKNYIYYKTLENKEMFHFKLIRTIKSAPLAK